MDFGELENDKAFADKVANLSKSIDAISEHIKSACDFPNYEELPTEDKVKFDLYLSYSINSLFWMLCKLQAIDTMEHGIRNEISRVRTAMNRHKQIIERNTIRPVIDVKAAGRFIRHGLWDPNKPTDADLIGPKSKKRKAEELT
ncbi:Nuclear nucleic acid-binding protein C1D [Pseudolycoriella hygida]|uniref:Nuclear nucleic acid-binding protein C1D n=1 Tax=Pseudolycoriella hygida TaxID=35572 RepID=A0A9Q0MXD8_9DIPT|nr:Nuclear nucleic acid-binding protein C1D [Pseudolycoriella hygida]